MDASIVADVVGSVLQEVSPLDRFMFYLRIEKNVPVGEISEIVGFSQDKVGSRLKKVYEKLRARLPR